MALQFYRRDGSIILPTEEEVLFDEDGSLVRRDDRYKEWAKEFLKSPSIKLTYLWNGKKVSSVYLGLDHNWDKLDERPLIFETAVFNRRGNVISIKRASTEKEIKKTHFFTCIKEALYLRKLDFIIVLSCVLLVLLQPILKYSIQLKLIIVLIELLTLLFMDVRLIILNYRLGRIIKNMEGNDVSCSE